jgi:hypothetical protein
MGMEQVSREREEPERSWWRVPQDEETVGSMPPPKSTADHHHRHDISKTIE